MKRIYHEREARVIYSLTTDRQPVIYWATNHLLARNDEKAIVSVRFFQFAANNFDCNRGVYMYFVIF